MKYTIRILVSLFFVSCQQKIEPSDVAKRLLGNRKVVLTGEDKDYSINVSYDYFEIGKNKGSEKSNAAIRW
jgi:hypothetical protein